MYKIDNNVNNKYKNEFLLKNIYSNISISVTAALINNIEDLIFSIIILIIF